MPDQATLPRAAAPYLDIADPAFSLRAPEVRAARDQSWYARTPYGLAILRHDQMGKLLVHKSLRQGSHAWPRLNGVDSGHFAAWWESTILVTEGDDHRRLRKLVNPAFSPKTVRHLMVEFERVTNTLVDGFIDKGECDFMAEFADPYAARVLTMLLGLPESDADEILDLSSKMGLALGVTYKQSIDTIEAATIRLQAFVDALIETRRDNPGDDVLSQLVTATVDGDSLTHEELRNLGVMLAFAGVDTTRNQLGLGLTMFLDHPEQWDLLARTPELDMKAATECMRVRPTITWVSREAVEDFEFEGLPIEKGTTLHLYSESAGTDPAVFGDATFDIAAKRDRNYGFGGGMHLCLGQIVARNDMAVAYRLLSQRITGLALNGTPTFLPDSGNTGPITLPIRFTPR